MREGESPDKRELLEQIDILVDGRYIKDLHDSLLQFRGSSNQRIIDVPKSLESGQVVAVVETTRSDAVHSRNLRQGPRRRGGGSFLNGFERFVYGRLELGKLTIFVV